MLDATSADSAVRAYYTFRAQGLLYGIALTQLREVSTAVMMTPVPQAPPGVRGLANLRSRIHLVLDLRSLLDLEPTGCTPDSRLIIFKANVVEDLGLLVDSGGDVVRVRPEQVEERNAPSADVPDASDDSAAPPVIGVCKLESELMMIIDPTRFVRRIARTIE